MTTEVLIIGGGLAGSATAITLARAGCDVVLVEREASPQHKVCGEFLSREALIYLHSLGIDPHALGAVPIRAVRLAGHRRVTEAVLPFAAMSLTRRSLDEAMLRRVSAAGAKVVRGCSVEALRRDGSGWQAVLQHGGTMCAKSVFLATGKHDLRGWPRPAGRQRGMIAFKMYCKLEPRQSAELAGHVELIAYRGGYAGLQPVEEGMANLCCLIQANELQKLGGRWANLLNAMQAQCPHLASRLRDAVPLLGKPLAISSIPYGFVREESDGLWQLGDQAAVIPSFTGDGMSIALHSGLLAAQEYLSDGNAQQFQQKLSREIKQQVRFATAISKALVSFPRACLFASGLWPQMLPAIARQTRIEPSKLAILSS